MAVENSEFSSEMTRKSQQGAWKQTTPTSQSHFLHMFFILCLFLGTDHSNFTTETCRCEHRYMCIVLRNYGCYFYYIYVIVRAEMLNC